MVAVVRQKLLFGGVIAVLSGLAACAPPKPVVVIPPPPPVQLAYVPPRPQPPIGAPAGLIVPPTGPDGVRQTVNARISPVQTIWNFRSAYNVAALNCLKPQHADILIGYRAFLKTHSRGLTAANRGVDSEFRQRHGASFIRPREAYMTQVYNYFAYPPTISSFCDVALVVSRESIAVKPADLPVFSLSSLTRLEQVFDQFYRSYEQYSLDAALWDAKYSPVSPVPATPSLAVPAITPPSTMR